MSDFIILFVRLYAKFWGEICFNYCVTRPRMCSIVLFSKSHSIHSLFWPMMDLSPEEIIARIRTSKSQASDQKRHDRTMIQAGGARGRIVYTRFQHN